MKTDVHFEKIQLVDGFDEQIKNICIQQASREEPRKLISIIQIVDEIFLVFELA